MVACCGKECQGSRGNQGLCGACPRHSCHGLHDTARLHGPVTGAGRYVSRAGMPFRSADWSMCCRLRQNLDGKCARELATSDAVFELLDEPKTAFTY